ncbi:unnamed protein product [Didymodactylos carnosus]|uniref:Uncharacterized protein n=1 Tax=Didymodactylos carnosus TaxID=1234261 RepID=A0A815S6B0_9BILA|nr:unnamed protein product [Didymodactylos carnosus]CAF1484838.1 unnamed protein product [Didymodactylos carnosus]CAF3678561.1 unnamed protein product [Didymodactylos carnosus]CAF4349088.1 unnamed protein product [Didymodactylos carnosus]
MPGLTRRAIVIQNTVKEMTSVTHLLDAIDLRYDFIVNKFDQVKEPQCEAFKQQIQNETKTCNLKNVDNIWFIAAESVPEFDWLQMMNAWVPNNTQ